ncbi:MAG: single-stranded DNA-binding protein [Thermoproteota archaeon]
MEEKRVKVADLSPSSKSVNIAVKVVNVGETREVTDRISGKTNKIAEALVGDETGTVLLTLWNENIDKVKQGDTIEVKNGYVGFFKGSMRLNVGRQGQVLPSDVKIESVNEENKMSEKDFGRSTSFRPRGRFRGRPRY